MKAHITVQFITYTKKMDFDAETVLKNQNFKGEEDY